MAQRFSQNGWPAYPDTSNYVRLTAANQGWWCANDDVAVVFKEFIERFDKEVEEITQQTLDDWSYANRLVRGSATVVSNHGSATAIDLNALKHGRGRRGTFSATKQVVMRRIKNSITDKAGKPVLRLGMDYVSIPDDMHVEINANKARVKEAADKIRERNKPKPAPKPAAPKPVTPPKEPAVATADLNLDQKIVLGEYAASHMSTPESPRKKGESIDLNYLLQWGGGGLFRVWKAVTAAAATQATKGDVARLEAKIDDLVGRLTPPDDGAEPR